MLDNIYGEFNKPRNEKDKYEQLWHKLAPQYTDASMKVLVNANLGMTQKKHEIIELWQLFDRMQPHIILEIGVAQGGTFSSWCQLAPDDALLIGIDRSVDDCAPFSGRPVHPDLNSDPDAPLLKTREGGGAYRLKRRGSNQRIEMINGWTYEENVMKKLLTILNGRKIDWIFHDASHAAEMTAKDYELFWPLVAPGGAMAFHDIARSDHPDVTKWKWWEERHQNLNFYISYTYDHGKRPDGVPLNQSMGIGVLFNFPEGGKL